MLAILLMISRSIVKMPVHVSGQDFRRFLCNVKVVSYFRVYIFLFRKRSRRQDKQGVPSQYPDCHILVDREKEFSW